MDRLGLAMEALGYSNGPRDYCGSAQMTMPVERTRCVIQTGDFLRELSKSQQIPEPFRIEAARLLRHYPEPRLLLHAAWLDEVIHSTEPGDPRRELAISGYPELFSSSLDE